MNNLAARLQNLETIKDFDLAISDSLKDFSRVSVITTNVAKSDVDLIIWLLLEKEFGINGTSYFEQDDKDKQRRRFSQADDVGSSGDSIDSLRIQHDGGPNHYRGQHLSKREQVLRYAETLLDAVGVNIPFTILTPEQRDGLFQLFCASSNLLRQEKYSSITDLYSAVRRRSKFREDFLIVKPLGNGSFGKVWSVMMKRTTNSNSNTTNTFALKKVILSLDLAELIPMILNESSILKALVGNEHIVQYCDSWFAIESEEEFNALNSDSDQINFNNDPFENSCNINSLSLGSSATTVNANTNTNNDNANTSSSSDEIEYEEGSYVFYLLMEQCWISLKEWKENYPDEFSVILTSDAIYQMMFELIDGIEWIHSKGFLHLDINPKNILWKDETRKNVVITDFGLAVKGPSFSERVGTTPYCSPEKILTTKSDIYSLGVSLFEICQQFTTQAELIHRIEVKDFDTGIELLDAVLPAMINHRPQHRLSASELKAKFFTSQP